VRAVVEGVCFGMRVILDRLDAVETVAQVRATGGAFRSALWREVMAAVLDRPFTVTAGLEGTALGAAALGLVALGDAPGFPEALARLTGPGEAVAVGRAPDIVAAYAALGDELRARIDELGAIAALARRRPGALRPGPVT
jgi:gluconokinase